MGKKKFPKNPKRPQTANAVQEVVAEAFSASAGPAVPQPHDRLFFTGSTTRIFFVCIFTR